MTVDEKEPHPGGRPTKYNPTCNEQAYKLCLLGFTDEELAAFFDVHVDTVYEWKKVYPEFSEAVNRGKYIADGEVAASLYKRSIGYSFEENTYEGINGNLQLTKTVEKEMAPDPGAALNWLKNRQPKKWRDKKEVDLNGNVHLSDEPITFE
jgi:hypothetical protein